MRIKALFLALVFLTGLPLAAQQKSSIPSPAQFLGYEIGERFTPHHQIVAYFEELARVSPKVRITRFGETYEGRPLLYAVIASEQHQKEIETIRADVTALSNPQSTTAERAKEIAQKTPVVVWLAYGIHGNESSSSEAAMIVAYSLLTDADSTQLLNDTVVIIDPLQNPDGRERYIHNFQQRRGQKANASPLALEHSEGWPSGRNNHYFIDMNRDWAWASQRETAARIAAYRQWYPQVFVDLHEMSSESTYFFPPDARPMNANLPLETDKWLDVFGRANAEAFSARSWPFFVGETFDLFYPGYGDSWPSFHGAIGMTYEMAGGGRAGSAIERKDGETLTLADRANHHYIASMTTIRTAARNRVELLQHTYRALSAQIAQGRTSYVIPAGEMNIEPVVDLLLRHGVTLRRLRNAARVRATVTSTGRSDMVDFAAGSIVIPTAQPLGGFIESLFERSPKFDESFLSAQREKATADEPTEFYDITAWSIPLAMNLRAYSVESALDAEPLTEAKKAPSPVPAAKIGYLVEPLQPDFYLFLGRLLQEGVRFSVSEAELGGSDKLSRGSLFIEKGRNGSDLVKLLEQAGVGTSIRLRGVDSMWTEGPALGSEKIAFVRDPKIALVGGESIDSNSFGMLWHTLDVETGIPHTVIPINLLGSSDLSAFRVVILPDTNVSLLDRLGKSGVESLRTWIKSGGTLVAIRGASEVLRAKDVEISKTKAWNAPKKDDEPKPEDERRNDFSVPGAAFATSMNQRSYITFGMTSSPAVLIEGTDALAPLPHASDNIVSINEAEPLVSGFAFPESIERLKKAPYVTREKLGGGSVITFADQPFYRLFWRATLPLLMNSIIYSPSFNERE